MRVIGRTKPRGAMKVKGGRLAAARRRDGALRGRSPTELFAAAVVDPYQSGAAKEAARGVRPFPPLAPPAPWAPGSPTGPARSSRAGRLYAGGRRPGTCHPTPSRESVVGLAGSAWALGWRAACLWAGRCGWGGFSRARPSPSRLVRRGCALRSCSVRRGLARVLSASTMSRHVGTRKMVNYAWPG